jgi:hypothetical protein
LQTNYTADMSPPFVVRGTHVDAARRWVDARLGKGTFVDFARAEDPSYSSLSLAVGWYDAFPLVSAMERAATELCLPIEAVAAGVTQLNAERDLPNVLRGFVPSNSEPTTLLSTTEHLWRAYVSFADARVIKNQFGYFTAECRNIPSELLSWAVGGWQGFLPRMVELVGSKNPFASILFRGPEALSSDTWLRFELHYE